MTLATPRRERLRPLLRVGTWIAGLRLRTWLIAIGALAMLVRIPLLFVDAVPVPDTPLYVGIAKTLAFGADSVGAEPVGTIRTPGYPLFLALPELLPGGVENNAVVMQHWLGAALAVGVAAFTWRFLGRAAGVIAGLLVALSPIVLLGERSVTPDFLFGALTFAGAAALTVAALRDDGGTRLLAVAGALFGFAAYVKPVGQVLALAGLLPLAFATRNLKATLRGAAVVAATVALVVLPWVVRNWAVYDRPALSTLSGVTLHLRVFDYDRFPVPDDTAEGRLVGRLREEAYEQAASEGVPPTSDYRVAYALQDRGYTFQEAIDLEGELARKAIRENLGSYLDHTWGLGKSFTRLTVDGSDSGSGAAAELKSGPAVLRTVADGLLDVGEQLTRYWWILTLGTFSTILLLLVPSRETRVAAASLMSAWLLTCFATAATTWPNDFRFAAQLAPLIFSLGAAAIVLVVVAVTSYLLRPRAP